MKESRLLWEGQAEIKLERGLKIMEFATQYNTTKAFYRRCSLPVSHPDATDIMSELSTELEPNYIRPIRPVPRPASPRLKSPSERDRDAESPQQLKQKITQDPLSAFLPPQEKPKSPEIISDLPSYVSDSSRGPPLSVIHEISKESSGIEGAVEQSAPRTPGSPNNHSRAKRKRVEQVEPKVTMGQPEMVVPDGLKMKKTSSFEARQVSQEGQPMDQSRSIRSAASIFDRPVSVIGSSSNNRLSPSSINESQKSILRRLSESQDRPSFSEIDRENMELLLKLENWEMRQSYLEQRIQKRLERTHKEVKAVAGITWESLNLPRPRQVFNRPNYAHVIE